MYSFDWQSFPAHVSSVLSDLFLSRSSTDLTLLCQDQVQVKTHRFLLSASSPFFREVLLTNCPVIYLRGVESQDMESLLEYLYRGRTTVPVDRVDQVLAVARDLQLVSLGDTRTEDNQLGPVGDDKSSVGEHEVRDCIEEKEDVKPPEEIVKEKEKALFFCPECGATFPKNASMRTHFRSKHKGVQYPHDYNPYNSYSLALDTRSNLSDSEAFVCGECGRRFSLQESLRIHTEAVHQARRLECGQCGETFSQSGSLSSHVKSQHQKVRLECEVCQQQYSSRGGLKLHRRNQHGIK